MLQCVCVYCIMLHYTAALLGTPEAHWHFEGGSCFHITTDALGENVPPVPAVVESC